MTTTTTTPNRLDNVASRQLDNRVRDILFAIMVAALMALQIASFNSARKAGAASDNRTGAAPAESMMSAQGACDADETPAATDADGQPIC